jgi:hypothetical protein
MKLRILPEILSVCRLEPDHPFPEWVNVGKFYSITKTNEELSVVCPQSDVPNGVKAESGFQAIQVVGPLDFSLTGIIASLTSPLAKAGISVFVVSTFDTDYILVKEKNLAQAVKVLGSFCEVVGN